MKYLAAYRQVVAKMVAVEANSKEEAEKKMFDAASNGEINLTMGDYVPFDDEVRFIDNPSEFEIECAEIDLGKEN